MYTTTKGIPAEFVAIMTEYGTSNRYTESGSARGRIKKKPFFRKSFNDGQINEVMQKTQLEASGGLLE